MEDFFIYLGIHRTFSVTCCMVWILSSAEGNIISKLVGNSVVLHCSNESIGTLSQLTWKMSNISLFSFTPLGQFHSYPEALSLNMNMSKAERQLYALVIETVQKPHTGNYTCETNTATGVWEQKWELIITEREESGNWAKLVVVVATVPCVCCLIFIMILIIQLRICKQCEENMIHSHTAVMEEQTQDIYENCLEVVKRTNR